MFLINYLCGGRENHNKPSTKYFKEVGIMADNKELLITLAQALGMDEIKERFPQFNHEAFLVQVED